LNKRKGASKQITLAVYEAIVSVAAVVLIKRSEPNGIIFKQWMSVVMGLQLKTHKSMQKMYNCYDRPMVIYYR